jgi:hypothetical protein
VKQYVIGYIVVGAVAVVAIIIAARMGRRSGRRALQQRLVSLSNRLGVEPPDDRGIEAILGHLEKVTGEAAFPLVVVAFLALSVLGLMRSTPEGWGG